MKKLLFPAALAASLNMYCQMGVNTPSPASTFDIKAKNTTGTSTNVDGLIIPRVDRQRAQSMVSIPNSTLIYINNIATGSQTGNAINIDTVGYYYFDATNVWTKLNSGNNPTNIYNADGTLTGNRTVKQNANTLNFTGTAVNAFSVDDGSLSVDAANNRVGIATTAPTNSLDVNGTARVRTINTAASALGVGLITPVYAQTDGVLVKPSTNDHFGELRSNNAFVIPNTDATMFLTIDSGIYKVIITSIDGCGGGTVAEYYYANFAGNNFIAVNGLGGMTDSGSGTQKSPTFNNTSRAVVETSWTGIVSCQSGGNATAFNYTLTAHGTSLNIKNTGNVTQNFYITLIRMF
ncbi:hypothetical protein [Chryseobacterium sp. IT-36CA2]|uniref:hypothetical protein n=1 Tax=Chryseobacterium sp. IT-36CA2 TaxID=3026460 RepID=UPI0039E16285